MAVEPVRAGSDWLALREPADAEARSTALVDRAAQPPAVQAPSPWSTTWAAAPARCSAGSLRACRRLSTGCCTTGTPSCSTWLSPRPAAADLGRDAPRRRHPPRAGGAGRRHPAHRLGAARHDDGVENPGHVRRGLDKRADVRVQGLGEPVLGAQRIKSASMPTRWSHSGLESSKRGDQAGSTTTTVTNTMAPAAANSSAIPRASASVASR